MHLGIDYAVALEPVNHIAAHLESTLKVNLTLIRLEENAAREKEREVFRKTP